MYKYIPILLCILLSNSYSFDAKEYLIKSQLSSEDLINLKNDAENNEKAASLLGEFYRLGNKIKKDHTQAVKYYLKSKNFTAYIGLANIYWRGGNNVDVNLQLSEKYFIKAAELSAHGKYLYGIALENGLKEKPDYKTSYKLFLTGSSLHSGCSYRVGVAFNYGRGVEKNYSTAAFYYQTAITQNNHPDAQFDLSNLKVFGKGIPKDLEGAYKLCESAALGGHERAQVQMIQYSIHNGKFSKAYFWYLVCNSHMVKDPTLRTYKSLVTTGLTNSDKQQIEQAAFNFIKKNRFH